MLFSVPLLCKYNAYSTDNESTSAPFQVDKKWNGAAQFEICIFCIFFNIIMIRWGPFQLLQIGILLFVLIVFHHFLPCRKHIFSHAVWNNIVLMLQPLRREDIYANERTDNREIEAAKRDQNQHKRKCLF